MNETVVYPGTFDPVTYGHLDVIKRISGLYRRVFVAVAHSEDKKPLFSAGERVDMLRTAVAGYENVTVEDFNGLVVEYAEKRSARVVARGIRMISDFEYEFQMALTNRKIKPAIETIFMMPNESYSYLSSKLIKEVAVMGADISAFVPPHVRESLKRKLNA